MKILKQGKVEMRKFVCEKCGCEFVANGTDTFDGHVSCPQKGCQSYLSWVFDGEAAWEIAKHLIENGVTFKEV